MKRPDAAGRDERTTVAVTKAEFGALMTRCGPFESTPRLAVAVSGGADSLALALLADAWARARRGRIVALTVDHGLRPEARGEARKVGRWLRRRGIPHRILAWTGAKPRTAVQAAAREARYRLLIDWCRRAGVLHLLLGHTLDDQAETVLLRLSAGSGVHGLAAMPAVRETADVRLLRPLLAVPRRRLRATLAALGQAWIEDPGNRDERFARVGVRRRLDAAREPAALRASIAEAAEELGRFRAAQEREMAAALARSVELRPEGYARLDIAALAAAPPGIGWRALAALLATVGGLAYAPRGDAVRALYGELAAGARRGRTLARCRLIPGDRHWVVVREARGIESLELARGQGRIDWDGRFAIACSRGRPIAVGALGEAGWAEAVGRTPTLRGTPVPYPARLSLAALRDRYGLAAVPSLGWRRTGRKIAAVAAFHPKRPLAPVVFAAAALLEPGALPVV